jgi:predicted cobalt transporter CbtA
MPADIGWNDEKGVYENATGGNVESPEYSPDPYAHAVRHLDKAEDGMADWFEKSQPQVHSDALIGIGWALLAIARKR